MAKDFEALIKAVLDTNDVPRQIRDEIENNPNCVVDLKINSKKLVSDIEQALSKSFDIKLNPIINTTGNPGNNIAQQVKSEIETNIERKTIDIDLKKVLKTKGIDDALSQKILDSFRKDVGLTELSLKSLDVQFERTKKGAKQLKSIKFTGIDEDGKTVTVLSKIDKKTQDVSSELTRVSQKFGDASRSANQTSETFTKLYNIQKQINSLRVAEVGLDISKNSNQIAEIQHQIGELLSEYAQLLNLNFDDLSQSELDKLGETAQTAAKKIDLLQSKLIDTEGAVGALEASTLKNKMNTWLDKNSKAAKEYGGAIEILNERLDELVRNGDLTKSSLREIEREFKDIQQKAISAGLAGKSFSDRLKKALGGLAGFFTFETVFDKTIELLQDMYQQVYSIDAAMVNLQKVTDETSTRYERFLSSAAKSAKELGRSISSLIEQTADWAKLGYSMDEAEELAKLSSIYANVAEVDDSTAVSDMVTAMKAFNIEASKAVTVIDPLNELGNTFATDAAALGDALSKSASAMRAAGTDMYKTLAMITGGSEITRNAGEFGNFLKVASMRIRGMKGELEELGEEVDESVNSISKVQTQILNLTHGKVNIFDDAGEFRDYYEIMKDIADVVDELTSTEQASLTEILFGKQRGNQGQALLQAFQSGQIEKAYQTAISSAGSAAAEQEKWMEGLEAKVEQFKAAWQELSMTVLDSDFLKGLVDAGTSAVEILTKLIDVLGLLPTVLSAAGITAFIKNLDCAKARLFS